MIRFEEVTITAGQRAVQNFDLTTGIYQLQEFRVTGEREGGAAATLSSALADVDAQVRRAALEKLAANAAAMDPAALEKALALAVRDTDPDISQLALTTMARVAPKEAVSSQLSHALASRVERRWGIPILRLVPGA